MKNYEYTYLTRQDISEEEADALRNKLAEFITAGGGAIVDSPKAYKKRLAYSIKKQDAAYVNTILFQSSADGAVAFKKEADIIGAILRGLLIAYDPEKLKKEIRRERFAAARAKQVQAPAIEEKPEEKEEKEEKKEERSEAPKEEKPAKPKRKAKLKAELRDIEEKLDEILK
jgi:ribosomal protein S6